jgi:carboxylesterase
MRRLFIVVLLLLAACSPPPSIHDRLPSEGNQPFEIDRGSDKGVLLLHGMTATPWEVEPLGDYLAKRNITVIAPLLPGHGTTMADLNAVSWEDWHRAATDNLHLLKNKTRRVYVAGMSMGADLAILLANENDIDGVIIMSPPIEFQDWRAKFASTYQYILPYASHDVVGPEVGHYYPLIPSHAVAEMNMMISQVKTVLPRVTTPALILQSINDKTVKPSGAEFVFENLGSSEKELRLYGNASHVLVQEQDAPDIIFYSVDQFLNAH